MAMKVSRIGDLAKSGAIPVFSKEKGFTLRDLVDGYLKDSDDGSTTDSVYGYGGKLNIRPAYQRNSVYNEAKRDAVIQTILEGCPLNVMYWVDHEDGTFEVLDGQQRILSICKYAAGEFSVKSPVIPGELPQDFHNLQASFSEIAEAFLDYQPDIYICKGTGAEKMTWFRRINTCGEPLNDQELRNSSYTGKWLSDAKSRFSTIKGRGVKLADENPDTDKTEPLLRGSWNRQDYLATALRWAAGHEGCRTIEDYMARHQMDEDASDLWLYFSKVLEWVRGKFPAYNKALCGMDWGIIYEKYQNGSYKGNYIEQSANEISDEIAKLQVDDDVTAGYGGIYRYIITGNPSCLSLRKFDEKTARETYEKQHHHCPYCLKEGNTREYAFPEMEADHIIPWSKGGHTVPENCQMLCKEHNRRKGGQ